MSGGGTRGESEGTGVGDGAARRLPVPVRTRMAAPREPGDGRAGATNGLPAMQVAALGQAEAGSVGGGPPTTLPVCRSVHADRSTRAAHESRHRGPRPAIHGVFGLMTHLHPSANAVDFSGRMLEDLGALRAREPLSSARCVLTIAAFPDCYRGVAFVVSGPLRRTVRSHRGRPPSCDLHVGTVGGRPNARRANAPTVHLSSSALCLIAMRSSSVIGITKLNLPDRSGRDRGCVVVFFMKHPPARKSGGPPRKSSRCALVSCAAPSRVVRPWSFANVVPAWSAPLSFGERTWQGGANGPTAKNALGDWIDLKTRQWRAERFRKYGW